MYSSKRPAVCPAVTGFTFGADPELFVYNDKLQIISCHDLLPGTKANPHPVPGGAVQVDGTAAEFNIDPSASFEEFNENIMKVLGSLQALLPPEHGLTATASHQYEEEYFDSLPYSAIELGCMPDYNAWTGKRNPKPRSSRYRTLRTAAGHLHIGWQRPDGKPHDIRDPSFIEEANLLIRLMDWHVGAWSCTVDRDFIRRELYGKAGACRYKPYGVEYRTLSNFWVMNETLRVEVWNRMQAAVADFVAMRDHGAQIAIPEEDLTVFINTGEMREPVRSWLY